MKKVKSFGIYEGKKIILCVLNMEERKRRRGHGKRWHHICDVIEAIYI